MGPRGLNFFRITLPSIKLSRRPEILHPEQSLKILKTSLQANLILRTTWRVTSTSHAGQKRKSRKRIPSAGRRRLWYTWYSFKLMSSASQIILKNLWKLFRHVTNTHQWMYMCKIFSLHVSSNALPSSLPNTLPSSLSSALLSLSHLPLQEGQVSTAWEPSRLGNSLSPPWNVVSHIFPLHFLLYLSLLGIKG
jgi:hypothetical protein